MQVEEEVERVEVVTRKEIEGEEKGSENIGMRKAGRRRDGRKIFFGTVIHNIKSVSHWSFSS